LVAVTGPAKLSYNNANCSLANNGDVATRTHNLTFTRNGNGEVRSVSDASANYQGLVVGGGQELEKTAAGWDLAILGKRITIDVYRRPGIQADLSIRTGQPLAISGTLRRLNRLVSSGSIIVDHNRARFSANFQPQNLQWNSAACNCPVSGTVRVDYSGSINSGGEVEFTSCGSAILRKDNGTERVLALKSCLVPNAI
jgi:hypothetical protein